MRGGGRKEDGERGGLRCGMLWCVVLFFAVSVSASPCLLCSPLLSFAVLSRSL